MWHRAHIVILFVFGLSIGVVCSANQPSAALELTIEGEPVQGGLLFARTTPGAVVHLDERPLKLDAEGRFVFGFGRDAATDSLLVIQHKDQQIDYPLSVRQRDYQVQRIDGLPSKMVSPDQKALERIRRENRQIAQVRAGYTESDAFRAGFILPAEGPISGVYGSQRILNGEPRRPHFGLDIAAPTGTAVIAPAAGTVALAEPDLYFTGGTLMIDHGRGITSVFSHLSALTVSEGDFVAQGEKIGEIGATGRATGPHLDWRVNWFEVRLDPALLLND
ncbi:MAG TPA: hypothetical protein DCO73_14455 [Alphaproteobacteria bacterium]|nr:hypothetical protein [Alphaproteobacteria bacterium]